MNLLARLLTALILLLAAVAHATDEAPYFQVRGAPRGADVFPLKSTRVHATLGLGFAEIAVTQTYKNRGETELDATYLFPCGETAAVHGLTMTVGDRRIEAVVKEKQEAKKTFEQAKAAGKTAALLEAVRPNVFSMNVARIRPGEAVTVELRYTERIKPLAGEFTWAFPTTVGPRYTGDTPTNEPLSHTVVESAEPPAFDLAVDLRPGFSVDALASPSHRLRTTTLPDGVAVRLESDDDGPVAMNRDFILRYRLRGDATKPRLLVQEWQGQRYLAVNWMPPARSAQTVRTLPREFVFVVDVSGSMHGFPLDTARKLLAELLQDLRPEDAFNIILFSGSSLTFSDGPVSATPEAIAQGLAFMNSASGGGGTELLPALEDALAQPRAPGLARTLVVVTDGYVTVEAEAYALVRRKLGDAALFPFGIGTSVNRELIARLARAGRTEPAIIEGPDRALTQARAFRHRIDCPVVAGAALKWDGVGRPDPLPSAAPTYADQPWSFVARLDGPTQGQLIFSGVGESGAFSETLRLADALVLPEGPLLARTWARDRLDELTDLYALDVDRPKVKDAIVSLGLGYNLLTQFTSFVAVDTVAHPIVGPAQQATQPNLLPAGVSTAAMGGAIPAAPEPATWAMLCVSSGFLVSWWRRSRKVAVE